MLQIVAFTFMIVIDAKSYGFTIVIQFYTTVHVIKIVNYDRKTFIAQATDDVQKQFGGNKLECLSLLQTSTLV